VSRDPYGLEDRAALVVDDNVRLAELAKWALCSDGWDVQLATSRTTALTAAASRPFALVLSDYAMPGGDGLLVLSELERLQRRCRLVLWSAALPASVARRARALGVEVLPGKLLGDELCLVARAALKAVARTPG
jgi:CheY-like chemotaxis protein